MGGTGAYSGGLAGAAGVPGLTALPFVTPEIDLLTLGSTGILAKTNPTLNGYLFHAFTFGLYVTQKTGTLSGSAFWKAGNDVAHSNWSPAATMSLTDAGTAVGRLVSIGSAVNKTPTDMALGDVVAEVSTAATGVTVLKGRLVLVGYFIPPA